MGDISFINSSTTSSPLSEEEYWHWLLTDGFIGKIFSTCLTIFEVLGLVGIVLVYLVARYMVKVEKKTGFVLLCIMSVFDFLNVITDLIADVIELLTPITLDNTPILCDIYVAVKGFAAKSSTFLIVLISCERFYATFYPFQYNNNVKVSSLGKAATLAIIYVLITIFFIILVSGNENGFCFEQRAWASDILVLAVIAEALLVSLILPCILTTLLNLLIVFKLKRRSENRMSERQGANQPAYKMLFSVSGVFIFSNLSSALLLAAQYVLLSVIGTNENLVIIQEVLNLLYPLPRLTNSCANFPVFFLAMKSFRVGLKKVLGFEK